MNYRYKGSSLYVPITYLTYGNMWVGGWNDPFTYLNLRDLL